MTRVEELEAEAGQIKKEMDWVSPANMKYPGGCMPSVTMIGYVFKGVRLVEIRRELAGLDPLQASQE